MTSFSGHPDPELGILVRGYETRAASKSIRVLRWDRRASGTERKDLGLPDCSPSPIRNAISTLEVNRGRSHYLYIRVDRYVFGSHRLSCRSKSAPPYGCR